MESITIEGLLDPSLIVAQYGWTDQAFLVEMAGYDSYPVSWEVTNEQGVVTYRGNLNDDGGNIQIDIPGVYNIQATVTDRLGREFTEQASVEVLPVIELTASADKAGLHLDEKLNLSLDTKNATKDQAITWEVKKDEAVYEGLDLSNISEISFIENGEYSFIAKTSDKAGREYESEEVLVRVIEDLDLSLSADRIDEPDAADALIEVTRLHEDEDAKITLTVGNGAPASVSWKLERDGVEVPVVLNDDGGELDFDEMGDGDYTLTATVTDELGREYTESVSLKVYPVITLSIDAPQNIHFDQAATIGLDAPDLGGLTVKWSVISETGAEVPNMLGNDGGTLNFTEPWHPFYFRFCDG